MSGINVPRSKLVREKLLYVIENLRIPYIIIRNESGLARTALSLFANDKRDFSDKTLDRLEPTVDHYLKVTKYNEKIKDET